MNEELKTRLLALLEGYRETCGDDGDPEADEIKREIDWVKNEVEALVE